MRAANDILEDVNGAKTGRISYILRNHKRDLIGITGRHFVSETGFKELRDPDGAIAGFVEIDGANSEVESSSKNGAFLTSTFALEPTKAVDEALAVPEGDIPVVDLFECMGLEVDLLHYGTLGKVLIHYDTLPIRHAGTETDFTPLLRIDTADYPHHSATDGNLFGACIVDKSKNLVGVIVAKVGNQYLAVPFADILDRYGLSFATLDDIRAFNAFVPPQSSVVSRAIGSLFGNTVIPIGRGTKAFEASTKRHRTEAGSKNRTSQFDLIANGETS